MLAAAVLHYAAELYPCFNGPAGGNLLLFLVFI